VFDHDVTILNALSFREAGCRLPLCHKSSLHLRDTTG
jgi:hypothetical protein